MRKIWLGITVAALAVGVGLAPAAGQSNYPTRPISGVLLGLAVLLLVLAVLPMIRQQRDVVFVEGET